MNKPKGSTEPKTQKRRIRDITDEYQRVAVFVDAQNLYHSAKNLYHSKVNFKRVLEMGVGNRQMIRAFIYVIATESGEETPFFEALEKGGYEIKQKDLQIFAGGMKKADWDVGMAVDATILADKVDVAILVTGDGDFAPLVEYLRINKGLKVEVMSFGRSTSSKLREVCDKFYDLDEEPNVYLMR